MQPLNIDNLQKCLKKCKFDAEYQKETDQLYTRLAFKQVEFPIFLRIYPTGELLQVLCFMPIQIPPDKVSGMARFLHLLNKDLDIPGFGMDEINGVSFFRCMVTCQEKNFYDSQIESSLHIIQVAAQTFFPTIEAISSGKVTFDEILEKAKKLQKGS